MTDVNDVRFNLAQIRRRAWAFWLVTGGAIILAPTLYLLGQFAIAKVVALGGTILSIATWLSAMMGLCPACRASFHAGYAPRIWPRFECAHCGQGMNAPAGREPGSPKA